MGANLGAFAAALGGDEHEPVPGVGEWVRAHGPKGILAPPGAGPETASVDVFAEHVGKRMLFDARVCQGPEAGAKGDEPKGGGPARASRHIRGEAADITLAALVV